MRKIVILATLAGAILSAAASAQGAPSRFDFETGGKLLLTRGITEVGGAGGGGITPWAVITGNETDRGIGGTVHYTRLDLPDFTFQSYGAAIGLFDRVEFSYARQEFDTGATGGALGLGNGFTFAQDIWGAKLRVAGDAVYGQDRWMPQIAVGVQYKQNDQGAVIGAVGGDSASGYDLYASATKLYLSQSLLVNVTARLTNANQNGLLGFGGDLGTDHTLQGEVSVGYMISRRLVVGAEYRFMPDNLGFARQDDWYDLFAAYAVNEHLTLTAAWADLGSIATFGEQRGLFLSIQAGF
ncbi:MAG: Hypothetical protein HLUCCA04_06440 [Oceanicaulis sp. HLUCCA04]|nr:MAG: Hypothetical protein HLUCCA04_06440 [Oceanicaulis sp. HLUCCA04]